MLTYQDLLEIQDTDESRMDFVRQCINQHRVSDIFKTAVIAEEYNAHRNVTIVRYQKLLYTRMHLLKR